MSILKELNEAVNKLAEPHVITDKGEIDPGKHYIVGYGDKAIQVLGPFATKEQAKEYHVAQKLAQDSSADYLVQLGSDAVKHL